MTVPEMRTKLKETYPGREWKRKVDRMPDRQVWSIWDSMQKREKKKKEQEKMDILHHQYTIDEWLSAFQKGDNNNEES